MCVLCEILTCFWIILYIFRFSHCFEIKLIMVVLLLSQLSSMSAKIWTFFKPWFSISLLISWSSSPMLQCPSGHTLCYDCKSKVNNKCPSCRKEMGHIRCLALEKLAASLHLPCKYHHLGCEETFPYYSKLKHEAECVFRPYSCPHPGSDCSVTGYIQTLLWHLRTSHKVDLQTGCTFNHRYVKQDPFSVDNVSWTLTVSSADHLPYFLKWILNIY